MSRSVRGWRLAAWVLGVVLTLAAQAPLAAIDLPPGFAARELGRGLQSPTAMAIAADGRVFVCEQKGALRLWKDGAFLAQPFLSVAVDGQRERGLVGVALHPDFPRTPYVYVYYTTWKPVLHNRLSRFTAAGDRALPGSERVLLELPKLDRDIHNGGALHFGPDGMLYVGVGENGVPQNAQSLQTPLGKLLRIDPDGGIPADNPFYATTSGLARAIWAYGLRNPFTFAFDRGSGRLYVNDVGFRTWEEIDEGAAGANYGWPTVEGPSDDPRFVAPIFAYGHGPSPETGCAIAGAAFYDFRSAPGPPPATSHAFPAAYDGAYFFADFCSGWIRRLDPVTHEASAFASGVDGPVDLRVGPDGALYYLGYGLQGGVGVLGRIEWTGNGAPAIVAAPRDLRVAVGAPATFRVSASGEAPLTYQWLRDGAPAPRATTAEYTLPAATAADDGARFAVTVSNGVASVTSATAVLRVVAGSAPAVTLLGPGAGMTYAGGEEIAFAGAATDAEDGALPAAAFEWRVDFHHREHFHPYVPPTQGVTSGSFVAFRGGETDHEVWFRVHLTVTDSSGLQTSTFADVLPRKARFTVATEPPGLEILLDGTPRRTPFSETGVVGVERTLAAPARQPLAGSEYELVSWAHGGPATQTIATLAADTTFTAVYRAAPPAAHGLLVTYFADAQLQRASVVRVEPRLDATWRGAPIRGVPADGFSVRWEAELEAPLTGELTLHLRSDDGARLRWDGDLVIDDWGPHAARTRRTRVAVVAGQRYRLVVEMRDLSGPASARLLWSGPGIAREVVPSDHLHPAASGSP